MAEDSGTLTIPFAVLLGNDRAGPSNENGQSLMVIAVDSALGGSVSISGTDVLFTTAANFHGAAGFHYTLQDNGTTNGSNDFRTSNAMARLSVTSVNDPPRVSLTNTITTLA